MTKKAMQTVVDTVCVQSDWFYEFIKDKSTHPDDVIEYKSELKDLCEFLTTAKSKGLNVERGCYLFADKLKEVQ